jgi:hypothetical protein
MLSWGSLSLNLAVTTPTSRTSLEDWLGKQICGGLSGREAPDGTERGQMEGAPSLQCAEEDCGMGLFFCLHIMVGSVTLCLLTLLRVSEEPTYNFHLCVELGGPDFLSETK